MRESGYKSVTPRELKERLDGGEDLVLLDVREPWEVALARIEGSKLMPMAKIPDHFSELDPNAETVVICHHGVRSAYVARLLGRSGMMKVLNLEGGLDAYSAVDPSVPRYQGVGRDAGRYLIDATRIEQDCMGQISL